ncbi:MAG: hypothetical protein ACXVYU_19445 [Oryzihumus sp.]
MRQPTFEATRLTWPAGTEAGTARSRMWAFMGATPPIIRVMPMSASCTRTTFPGNDDGAAQMSLERW